MRTALLSILYLLLAWPAFAGELSLLGGYGVTDKPLEKTFAWQIQYMEGLGENFAYSISYVNQGHFIEHHRDGYAANLWARTNLYDRQLSLGVGVGGLFYFDTTHPATASTSQDYHGWGTMANLEATWYTESRWYYQLRGYWVRGDKSFDTLSMLAGIGYQLDAPPSPGPDVRRVPQPETTTDHEVTVFGGQAVVNVTGSGDSRAVAIGYRRGLWRTLEWTAGALYEGKSGLINRYGLTTQLWLAKHFLDDKVALGAGFGGYFGIDERRGSNEQALDSNVFLAKMASMSASYRLNQEWQLRANFDRVITDYNRDSDIFMAGVGYRF